MKWVNKPNGVQRGLERKPCWVDPCDFCALHICWDYGI